MKILISFVLALFLVAPAYAAHDCGHGPVKIKIKVPGGDCNTCTTETKPLPDGTYEQGLTICTALICTQEVEQEWSDWPECNGKEFVKAPAGEPIEAVIKVPTASNLTMPGHAK